MCWPMLVNYACQILPEWMKDAPRGRASLDPLLPSSLRTEALRLHGFMADARGVDAARQKLSQAGASERRVPNQEYIKSYEHALQAGLGLTFKHFQPSTPVRPLLPEESRYFVPHESTGSQFRFPEDDPPGRLRACIHNDATGKDRPESRDAPSCASWQAHAQAGNPYSSRQGLGRLPWRLLAVLEAEGPRLPGVGFLAPGLEWPPGSSIGSRCMACLP